MTTGNPYLLILQFAVPLFIGNVFQQLYNMVDAVVVGQFVGIRALAAVGAAGPCYHLIIAVINGFCSGASVVIAQIFGGKEKENLKRAYLTTWKILLLTGIAFTALGLLFGGGILKLLGTPQDVYTDSYLYVRIMCWGILATCLYNGMAAFLRSIGNSRVPLIALIISSVTNIILDLALVLLAGMGVSGVAIATVAAQLVSGLYCLLYVHKNLPEMKFRISELQMDPEVAEEMVRIGLPATFSTVVVTVSTMFIQAAVNRYGSIVVGAYTVGNRVELICMCLAFSIGLATGVFCGQNTGAGDEQRTIEGFHAGTVISLVYSALMGGIMLVFAKPLIRVFSSEAEVFEAALPLIRITAWFAPMLGIVFIFQNFLRNVSDVRPTVLMSFAEIFSRGVFPFVLSGWYGYYGIWWATPIGWTLSALIGYVRYRSGKWKGKAKIVKMGKNAAM